MRKDKGSITVFLSLIIVIVMAFIGGLIDGTRMRTAETQVNRAVDNGTKSILASYNKDLKDTYGLFAYSGDEAKMQEIVLGVIKDNLIIDGDGNAKYVDIYDYKMGDISVNMNGPLTQMSIIKEQIIQNMKYRAPINLLEGFLAKLDLFKDMNKYSDTLKEKEKLDKGINDIDKDIEKLEKSGEELQTLITNTKSDAIGEYKYSDMPKFIYINVVSKTVEEVIAAALEALKESVRAGEQALEEEEKKANEADRKADDAEDDADDARRRANQANPRSQSLDNAADRAEARADSARAAAREASKKADDLRKDLRTAKITLAAKIAANENLGSLKSNCINHTQTCYENKSAELKTLKDKLTKFKNDAEAIQKKIDDLRDQYDKYDTSVKEIKSKTSNVKPEGVGLNVVNINDGFEKEREEYEKIFSDQSKIKVNIAVVESNEKIVDDIQKSLDALYGLRDMPSPYNMDDVTLVQQEVKEANKTDKKYNTLVTYYDNSMDKTKGALKPDSLGSANNAKKGIDDNLEKLNLLNKEPPVDIGDGDPGLKDEGEALKDKKEETASDEEEGLSEKTLNEYISVLPSKNPNTEDYIIYPSNNGMAGVDNSNIEKSLDEMDILAKFGEALEGIRDKIFINEYVMTRLKDRVVLNEESEEGGKLARNRVPQMAKYDFDSALDYEIEYILAGNTKDSSNRYNVWWKMYACRVLANSISIRGIEECKKMITTMAILTQAAFAYFGIPLNITWLKALYTVAWVANESKEDMDLLVKGHQVPLYKKDYQHWLTQKVLIPSDDVIFIYDNPPAGVDKLLSTVYSDYLRLFLILQPVDTTVARIEDIIQVNMKIKSGESFDLSKAMTQVNVSGDVSIKYMFFNLNMMSEYSNISGRYSVKINKSLGF